MPLDQKRDRESFVTQQLVIIAGKWPVCYVYIKIFQLVVFDNTTIVRMYPFVIRMFEKAFVCFPIKM